MYKARFYKQPFIMPLMRGGQLCTAGLKWKFIEIQQSPKNKSEENYQLARSRLAWFTINAQISTQKDKFLN